MPAAVPGPEGKMASKERERIQNSDYGLSRIEMLQKTDAWSAVRLASVIWNYNSV